MKLVAYTKSSTILMTYRGHSERIVLAVTRLGKQSMILGFTWLEKHNPEIEF